MPLPKRLAHFVDRLRAAAADASSPGHAMRVAYGSRELGARLRADRSAFDLDASISELGLSAREAHDAVAMLYRRCCERVTADGVITPTEAEQLVWVAGRLKLSARDIDAIHALVTIPAASGPATPQIAADVVQLPDVLNIPNVPRDASCDSGVREVAIRGDDARVASVFMHAARHRVVVAIRYGSPDGEDRAVEPSEGLFYRDAVMVSAWQVTPGRAGWRTFRLDRVHHIQLTGTPFSVVRSAPLGIPRLRDWSPDEIEEVDD